MFFFSLPLVLLSEEVRFDLNEVFSGDFYSVTPFRDSITR